MNERQKINFERIANGEPLLPPVNEQEIMQVKLNERINESRDNNLEIAIVHISCVNNPNIDDTFPMCEDRYGGYMLLMPFSDVVSIDAKIPLYKGKLDLAISHSVQVEVSGNVIIEDEEEDVYYLRITGDGAITITSVGAEEE